jgi:hypothetical protein
MRDANNKMNEKLVNNLEQIKELLETTIDMVRADGSGTLTPRKIGKHYKIEKVSTHIDFSKPIRPFVKQHAAGMNGSKKFTLVLAHLAGGDHKKSVSLDEIQKCWTRMTAKGLLGMKFNRFYSAEAKNNDWVNTEKNGLYHLRPSWKEIFDEGR